MRYLTLLGIFLAILAVVFYFVGSAAGAAVLLVAGGVILVGIGSLTGQ